MIGRQARSLACAALLAGLATACTDYPPTVTTNPPNIPPESGNIVSVCYDTGDHQRREIEAVAMEACPKPVRAVTPWHRDRVFNDCPLLKKSRISFRCEK